MIWRRRRRLSAFRKLSRVSNFHIRIKCLRIFVFALPTHAGQWTSTPEKRAVFGKLPVGGRHIQIELAGRTWNSSPSELKGIKGQRAQDHVVPLSGRALEIIEDLPGGVPVSMRRAR